MKNIKTNAMLLTLGLLVSGSVMHADVTQDGQKLKELITTKQNTLFTNNHSAMDQKNNSSEYWNDLMRKQVFPFIKKKANTFPSSAKL